MSREIRITIADDEVFERMRHRKDALDLSWEEALRRGLTESTDPDPTPDPPLNPFDDDFKQQLKARIRNDITAASPDHNPPDTDTTAGSSNHLIDRDAIRRVVADHLDYAIPPGPQSDAPLDAELDALEDAEDARLEFPFLDDDHAAVPLRVNLTTDGDGLDVTVVAVRRGKATADDNTFRADHREQITTALATGTHATLSFQHGTETYAVTPSLSWGRTSDGHPTVVDVTIDAVHLDPTD